MKSEFFTLEEMSLPELAQQPARSFAELYQQAGGAVIELDKLLHGVAKELGLRVLFFNNEDVSGFLKEMDKAGSVLVVVPTKDKERAAQKVKIEYNGDFTRLIDVVRATIAVESLSELKEVVKVMRKRGMVLGKRPEDSFANPPICGSRRLKVNPAMSNGHIAEVLLHLKGLFKAVILDHKPYERVRKIESEAKARGQKKLSGKELEEVLRINKMRAERFEAAWKPYSLE